MLFEEGEVDHGRRRFERILLKGNLPLLHFERVTAGTVEPIQHLSAIHDRLPFGRRLVDKLIRRRFVDQA